jgi:hypothetical protein
MITPQITVEVTDQRVMAHLDNLPEALRTNLRATITELTNELLGRVLAREPVRTGLMRSRTRAFVDDNRQKDFIRGRVRILRTGSAQRTAAAFGALEYGAHRRFPVRAYRRGGSNVGAYERTANIRERRFLRGPAEAMRNRIIAEIRAAVARSVQVP